MAIKVISPPSSLIEGLTFSITFITAGSNSSSENGINGSPYYASIFIVHIIN
jgi:hypothetical protein